jgi:hypothetical protein
VQVDAVRPEPDLLNSQGYGGPRLKRAGPARRAIEAGHPPSNLSDSLRKQEPPAEMFGDRQGTGRPAVREGLLTHLQPVPRPGPPPAAIHSAGGLGEGNRHGERFALTCKGGAPRPQAEKQNPRLKSEKPPLERLVSDSDHTPRVGKNFRKGDLVPLNSGPTRASSSAMAVERKGHPPAPRPDSTRGTLSRPFLVGSFERRTELRPSGTWQARETDMPPLPDDPAIAWRLAEHWTEVALSQHSAIASLARTTLCLLACQAPPELVKEYTLAQRTKVEHAMAAFRLASWFADAPVGPGPLDLGGSMDRQSTENTLSLVIREGCFGEALAQAQCERSAQQVAPGALRDLLLRFALDSAGQSALAWNTIHWFLGAHPAGRLSAKAAVAEAAFELRAACAAHAQDPRFEGPSPTEAEFGMLAPSVRRELALDVASSGVKTAAALLLSATSPG